MTIAEPFAFDFDPEALWKKYLQERDRRLREDHQGQYVTIGEGKGAKYAEWFEDHWTPKVERAPLTINTTVVVLGSGFSGIQMGAKLKQYGVTDFKIIDRAGDFGGTWYWNRYPGVACDSEAYCYLPLLEETNYCPTYKYAGGPEIRAHCARMGRHFGLYDHAIFSTAVKEFSWDDDAKVWIGTTDRDDKITTKFLVVCGGPINHPHLPDVEGIETFAGKEFHTARWDYEFTGGDSNGDYNMTKLGDKTVAIIGTGATAIQCIPYLGQSCKKLIVFQRTPSAVDVRDNTPTDQEWFKSLEPGWQAKRDWAFQLTGAGGEPEIELDDGFSRSFRGWFELAKLQAKTGEGKDYTLPQLLQFGDFKWMERIRRRCDEIVKDKKTAEALKPWYNLWCKRPVYSDTYLQTFNRPNVELVDTSVSKGIEKITPKGIVVAGVEHEVDVIIWSTGYTLPVEGTHHDFVIRGRGGVTWNEKMEKKGGYASLYGLVTSDFPNYLQFGNRQAAVSVNFPSVYNDQAIFTAYVLAQAIKLGAKTIECTKEAEEEWTQQVLAKSRANPEFRESCTPGYYNAEGDSKKLSKYVRSQVYGGGPLEYRSIILDYVKSGELKGFEVVVA
ncbi:putative monooxygenase [Gonapodya prolifera JEL478]|uniref:Putative monooxygenase n=1 Tax=Gonapodya prolifera (strain JEL478) TaxID=1344416 RepID=A0A139AZW7_GONPJ|nr:putative monooxygenase [Gonapodya prolifera JEL478]|eukprot:KXS22286.1 putative monooxygenase [Gonapodya prolifera JEL478]